MVCNGNRMLKLLGQERRYVFKSGHEMIVLDWEEICFLESYQKKTFVCTAAQRYRVQGRLDEEERRLSGGPFVRVHQSFLVNLNFVWRLTESGLVLRGGQEVPVSVRKRRDVELKLKEFFGY